jgi:hypothetical protein
VRPVGTAIAFAFTPHRVTHTDPVVRRTGRGIVVGNQDYSVWPCPGYTVRVTESPDYQPGEILHLNPLSVRSIQE